MVPSYTDDSVSRQRYSNMVMVSRAYIYCSRPNGSVNKVTDFRLLRKHRQQSTTEMHPRTKDESRLSKLHSAEVYFERPQNNRTSTKMTWMGKSLEVSNATQNPTNEYKSVGLLSPGYTFIDRSSINSSSSLANSEANYSRASDSAENRIAPSREPPREKKVTFILDSTNLVPPTSKKPVLTAQIRRQNFRTSHSKGNKNTVNSSTDSCGNVNSSFAIPKTPDCSARGPEVSVHASVDWTSPRPAGKRVMAGNDRPKQQTMIKRKLKSCRSRSFHKSLDSSMVAQQNSRIPLTSYKRPVKALHPEVVTMISLVGLYSDEAEQINPKAVNITPETVEPGKDANDDIRLLPIVSIKTKADGGEPSPTGIVKFTGSTFDGVTFTELNSEQKRNPFLSSKTSKFSSVASKITAGVNRDIFLKMNATHSKSLDSENVEPKFISPENQSFSRCELLQSTKEKECWSSFHKMSKKGLFVSLDTILRGLLTPTEYRLRKDDVDFHALE